MQLHHISRFLEAKYPLTLQESYDNAGLIYGRPETEITGVLISLDVTEAVVAEALASNCNLIIAHHPVIFKGIKKLNGQTFVERVVERCIQNGIALYAIHTNLDNHSSGVNAKIAAKLGLQNCRVLRPMNSLLHKLEVYVPETHFLKVDQAILNAGAGQIGYYKDCHFRTAGTGTFTPTGKAQPHTGKLDVREEVQELKLEYVVESHLRSAVITAMSAAHPYEEVAYHLIPTHNVHQERGAGMVGTLAQPVDTPMFWSKSKLFLAVAVSNTLKLFSHRFRPLHYAVELEAFCSPMQFALRQTFTSLRTSNTTNSLTLMATWLLPISDTTKASNLQVNF